MIFSAPLGPGHVARQQLCRAGESLVWATYRQTFHYAVDGLDQLGAPGRSLFGRGLSAVGRGAGDLALTVLGGGGDTADDNAPAADHLVFGRSSGSLAPSAMSRFSPGTRVDRLWALTSDRLVVAERAAAPVEEPAKSFLGKAIGFGREVGKILSDNRRKYGDHVEGEPVTAPAYEVVHEFPRAQIAHAEPGRVTFTDGSGVEFLLDSPTPVADEVVVRELTRFWLRPGEHLVLGLPPIVAHVGGVVGGALHVPWTASGPMPSLDLDKPRWPLPAPPSPPDWIDDPTLGYWLEAPSVSSAAVSLADHFAFSLGNARLAVSDQRVAVVYPTHLFEAKPSSVFTTFAEIPRGAVRSVENTYAGCSLPARPVVRLTFADGSALTLRRP
ncbi:hypothetical protein [Lentzea sp. NPDC059081]|uniref:hypothetical protein n=1 Tax=Lentzea sp. NPDC059081 TaxID=3346719 RepID=UPI003690C6F4